jgi:hypothetical protein
MSIEEDLWDALTFEEIESSIEKGTWRYCIKDDTIILITPDSKRLIYTRQEFFDTLNLKAVWKVTENYIYVYDVSRFIDTYCIIKKASDKFYDRL